MTSDREGAWDSAPCGLLTLRADGTIEDANATFLAWVERDRTEVAGLLRLSQLLSVGGRIYWETHLGPLLSVDGHVDEVAVELRTPQGRLPVLMTAVVSSTDGAPAVVHVVLSSARERSRYERALLAARRDAERSAARTLVLQQVTAGLSRAVGAEAVVAALLAAALGPLGASAATYWRWDAGRGLVPHAAAGEEVTSAPRPTTGLREWAAVPDGGRVVVPLRGQGPRGVLSIVPRDDPATEPMDLQVLTAVGQQGGIALDRAAMYEERDAVARQLQRALLAAELPEGPGFEIATAYRAGVTTLEVGGDFYDAFLVDDDTLAVVLGDVVGRGLRAASAMGQLRSAVRAVAAPGVGPGKVLSQLDRFVQQVDAATSATLVYAEVRLSTGRVRYACAGQLPPLVAPVGGGAALDWEGRSTPLGLVPPGAHRGEAELRLEPGDQLLLYTDGLVERRDRSLADGLDVLVGTAAGVRADGAALSVTGLTERLLAGTEQHDDVCLLLLSWRGGTA